MRSDSIAYFIRARRRARLLLIAGVMACSTAAGLWRADHAWAGASAPLLIFGLAQVVNGSVTAARVRGHLDLVLVRLVKDPAGYRERELHRMTARHTELRRFMALEGGLCVIGLALLAWADFRAFGTALAGESAFMLLLDGYAWWFASRYKAALGPFLDPAAPILGEHDLGE